MSLSSIKESSEDPPQTCPVCGGEVEQVNCVYACIKCDWWEYSSS